MRGRKYCPNCGKLETEGVHTEWHRNMVEEIRICTDCDIQYTNTYTLEIKEQDEI